VYGEWLRAEYHLPKVFSKPGIRSGRRLRHYLALA